jgi:hypothetical protein
MGTAGKAGGRRVNANAALRVKIAMIFMAFLRYMNREVRLPSP